jgi:serine acetyltransferase
MEHAWWWGSTSPFLSNRHIDNLKTRIGADVWIGANAVVRQSVSVERGSVVGAGAVVLNDVPPYSIVVGQPARVLKRRFSDEIIEQLENSRFWELEPKEAKRKLDDISFPSKPEWLMGMQIAEK